MSPTHRLLDVADPPVTDGRFHRRGGRATWYGSTSEAGAWAEFARNPHGVDVREAKRRIGSVTFDVTILDLTNGPLLDAMGLSKMELTSRDQEICQALAELAVEAGFEAVLGPSAALAAEATLAVFAPAISTKAVNIVDRGVRTPPSPR